MTKYLFFLALLSLGCSNSQPATSGSPDSAEAPATDATASFILDEVIVKLRDGAHLEDVLFDFQTMGIIHKEDIAPRSGLYLLSYDREMIDSEQILDYLRAHESILEAQFNKQLQERD